MTTPQATIIDEQGRIEPPLVSDELGTLEGFLEFQRATFAWKCRGLDAAGLNTRVGAAVPDGRTGEGPNLRWILVHLIEEYARHNGHADLLREAVDGETGE